MSEPAGTLYSAPMVLGIDTCGSVGTIALVRIRDGALLPLGQTELPGKTYSAQLVPAIRELLATQNAVLTGVDAIVVTRGPGSFTGIRIAISVAKGLSEVHSIPLLAVSRLAVLADKTGVKAAALDASRREFYFRGQDADEGPVEQLLTAEELQASAAKLGIQLAICEDSAQEWAPLAHRTSPPTAADALKYALPRLLSGNFDDPMMLDGNYLRRSDAEIFSRPAQR